MKHFYHALPCIGKMLLPLSVALLYGCERHTPRLDPEPRQANKDLHLTVNLPNEVALRSGQIDPMTTVRQLRLVFYDKGASPSVQEVRDIAISSPDQLIGLSIQIPESDYQLVAIANPSPMMNSITQKGAPLNLVRTGQKWTTKDFMQTEPSDKNKCLAVSMLNEQGVVDVPLSSFGKAQSPIQVNIEPALARLYVFGTPTLRDGEQGRATPGYTIVGTQVETSPMRMMAKLSTGEMEVAGDNSPRTTRYAMSPLWSQWGETIPEQSSKSIQHRTSIPAFLRSNIWLLMQSDKTHAHQDLTETLLYAKEATLPAHAFTQGTTPCVIVRYPYVPRSIAPLEANEGFIRHRGKLYKEGTVRSILSGTSVAPDELAQALETHGITLASLEQPFDKGDLQFYKDAYSYYVIYIRHFAEATESSSYGRYGLVRGNEYSVKITSILDTGLATPPMLQDNHRPISEYRPSQAGVIVAEVTPREEQEVEL